MITRTARGSRVFLVGSAIGSMTLAGGCGGTSSDSQALPPPKSVHEAMKTSMKAYMEKQMQKTITKKTGAH